jgi:hypothetical protein
MMQVMMNTMRGGRGIRGRGRGIIDNMPRGGRGGGM